MVLIYRQGRKGGHSIEALFQTIAGGLRKHVDVVEFIANSRWKILQDVWRLKRLGADIYHITGDVNYFSLLLPRSKTVLTVHDTGHFVSTLRGVKRFLYKWLWLVWPIRMAGKVTAISEATQTSIKEELGCTQEVTVINNCHGAAFHPVPKPFNEESPLVLQVGTQPNKNLARLIEALKDTSCRLCIIGKLNSEQVQQLRNARIPYQNHFNLSHQEVFEQYVAADLVCFASLYEGFGVPVIEANVVGRPLITANLEPMRSIAGDAACLVDPTNTVSIKQAVLRIVQDREYRERLVANGYRNAERFTPSAVAARYLDVYRSLYQPPDESKIMTHRELLVGIDAEKILWVGGYPAHYVRQMHLAVEAMRPGAMHFIYIADSANVSERCYERGQLPTASTVLESNYPVKQFLGILQKTRPKALIITGYNLRLVGITLLWAYWKRARFSHWCDTNLLINLEQNPLLLLIKRSILKVIFSRAHKLLYIGARNRDFYIWLLGLRLATDKLFFLPYPAILTAPRVKVSLEYENFSPQDGRNLNIIYLGRLEPIKAVHKLLHALALLPTAVRNNVHLDIYGGGSEEDQLKGIAVTKSILDFVSFHGPIASDQVAQAYAKADLFVLPSDREPWGLVVNEALSAGIPVMCPFWVGAAADLITDGETGYILENNTPACIAAGIERAYQMGLANRQLGTQGRTRITTGGWNVEAASAGLVRLVDDLSRKSHE